MWSAAQEDEIMVEALNEEEVREYIVRARKEKEEYHKYLQRVKKYKRLNQKIKPRRSLSIIN